MLKFSNSAPHQHLQRMNPQSCKKQHIRQGSCESARSLYWRSASLASLDFCASRPFFAWYFNKFSIELTLRGQQPSPFFAGAAFGGTGGAVLAVAGGTATDFAAVGGAEAAFATGILVRPVGS